MKTASPSAPVAIACFGECLWDCLPRGLFLGGAPLNVGYHLNQHGVRAWVVSAVGRDFLGQEACRRVAGWGMETRFIAQRADRATGVVFASLDAKGVARYRIQRDVAWDHIPLPRVLPERGRPPAAVVYGTLALRESANRRVLTGLLRAWPDAWRVVDLNLRAPFDRQDAIAFALRPAGLVKLNDEELARMTSRRVASTGALERAVRGFAQERQIARVCVTAGARGAGLLWDGDFFWEPARSVVVRDTVGSGDAFLGALLAALLRDGARPPVALRRACRMGEFVAGCDGPTPPYRAARA